MKILRLLPIVICLSVSYAKARDLFRPLSDDDQHNWILLKWEPIAFRVQYHGFVESSTLNRYIFVVDGEMVYLQPGEIAQQQFILKQVLLNGQQVLIEDMLTNELQILKSGEISYIPGKFDCTLLDKKTGQTFTFSDARNHYQAADKEIFVSQKGSDLHVWEIAKGLEPVLCVYPTLFSK